MSKNSTAKQLFRIPVFIVLSPVILLLAGLYWGTIFLSWIFTNGLTWKGAIKRMERSRD